MVVTSPYSIEQGGVDLDAERLAAVPGDGEGLLEAAPAHVELQLGLVGEELVLDDV